MPGRPGQAAAPAGAVKPTEAPSGRVSVAIALDLEPRNRRVHTLDRQTAGLADLARRDRVGRERHRAQGVRHLVEFLAGTAMAAVQYRLPAVLVMDAARQRTYPDRHRQQYV